MIMRRSLHRSVSLPIALLCVLATKHVLAASPRDMDVMPSLTNEPFVHPKAIEDLQGSIADSRDAVVALDMRGIHKSNRYCCEPYTITTNRQTGAKGVGYKSEPGEPFHAFSYEFLGQCDSGIIVLYTFDVGEGSMSVHSLLLLRMAEDRGLALEENTKTIIFGPPRMLLMKMEWLMLGDRWKGQLKVQDNRVFVGKDHGWFSEERDYGDVVPRTNDWESIWTIDLSRRRQRPLKLGL